MALQISVMTNSGIQCDAAYLRVKEIKYTTPASPVSAKSVQIVYEIFVDAPRREAGNVPIESRILEVYSQDCEDTFPTYFGLDKLDSRNPIKAAYAYLKSLPEFAEAVDA